MSTSEIIEHLEHQRERIEAAIAALNGNRPKMRRGERKKSMPVAARKRISLAQKKRWREQKVKAKA